jgi:hypothetical protein
MQNYGFPTAEYQKYYGSIKEYGRGVGSTQAATSGIMKYPDPNLSVTMQEKYLPKQAQYQATNGAMMQNGVIMPNSGNMTTGMTNPYFNPQLGTSLNNLSFLSFLRHTYFFCIATFLPKRILIANLIAK